MRVPTVISLRPLPTVSPQIWGNRTAMPLPVYWKTLCNAARSLISGLVPRQVVFDIAIHRPKFFQRVLLPNNRIDAHKGYQARRDYLRM